MRTIINGMGSISYDGANFSTEGLRDIDIMHISEDFFLHGGVLPSLSGFPVGLKVVENHLGVDRSVDIGAGKAYILNSDYVEYGESNPRFYPFINPSVANLELSTNTSGSPRIDLIVAKIDKITTPNGYATNVAIVEAVEGTPAGSPVAPTLPNDCIALAEVYLAHNYSTVANAVITDKRIIQGLKHYGGWNPIEMVITRTGNHSFTVPGDYAGTFRKGTKIRYVDSDGAYEFGVVASATYGAPNTTVNLIPNTDYAMASSQILYGGYSYIENPAGFPQWFNYSPTLTGITQGNGTIVAKWRVSGLSVEYVFKFVFGSSGSAMGNGIISAPVEADSLYTAQRVNMGEVYIYDNGTAEFIGYTRLETSTTLRTLVLNAASTYLGNTSLSSSVPMTWANGDILMSQGRYKMA